jgi:hypothetical protein
VPSPVRGRLLYRPEVAERLRVSRRGVRVTEESLERYLAQRRITHSTTEGRTAQDGSMSRYMPTMAEIRDRQQAEVDAVAKAAADPGSLVDADMRNLPSEKIAELMDSGELRHMGIGPRRTGRRH